MFKNYRFLALLLLLLISSPSLYSQDDETDTSEYKTDEIVITGTRLEQKIIDIPYPVLRINQNSWITSRKIGVQDVLLTVPGLFLQPRRVVSTDGTLKLIFVVGLNGLG